MEENNFNNNPINNELPQQPVQEPVVQSVQEPTVQPVVEPVQQSIVEPVQSVVEPVVQPVQESTVQAEVEPAPQPIESNIEINPVAPETPQISVSPAPAPVKKSGNNKTGLMAVLILVLLMFIVVGVLFATGKLDFGTKKPVEQVQKTESYYKTVNNVNLTKNSKSQFNNMTVEITQSNEPTGAATSSVRINGVEINDKVNIGGIYSYTIYYDYVVFYSVATSSTKLSIYNPKDGSVISYTPTNSFGYMINSYYVANNKIIMNGTNVAAQYGMKDPGYNNAELEISYSDTDKKLSGISIVKKYNQTNAGVIEEVTNSSVSYKTINNIKGNSSMNYNNINVVILQDELPQGPGTTSVKINGTEVKDKVTMDGIYSYTIYNTYVIFLTGNNSGLKLVIYNTKDGSIKDYTPENLGYMAKDYEIGESKIIIKGVNVSAQFGVKDTGYKNADIELVYSNGTFGEPKVVKEYNKKATYKDVNSVVGNSRTIFNGIDVSIQQNPETSTQVCSVNSVKVNGKEIKDKLSNLCVYSYSIYDDYVLFFIAGTSIAELRIYDTKTDSITDKYVPSALEGYMVKDYTTFEDGINVYCRNVGEQVQIQNSGKQYAAFNIGYSNGKFGTITKMWERDTE